jgi:hypothetical protein
MDYSESDIQEFLEQLDDVQKLALNIAKDHLGTSFDISKSNAFVDYMKSKK